MSDRSRAHLDRRSVLAGLLGGAGAALAPALSSAAEKDPPPRLESVEITARQLAHFERGKPETKRFGQLEFRGGLVLSSPSSHFGGWSGLVMGSDGKSLLAVSDVGSWMSAEVVYEGRRAAAFRNARIGPLLDRNGRPLKNKREQDAESLTLLDGTLQNGTVLIGFERLHRVGRFPVRKSEIGAPSGYLKLPADARAMRDNQGIEALAVLQGGPRKGSVVAFAERLTRGSGYHTGWIWGAGGSGEAQKFQLEDIDGFNVTDAAGLPDGSLVVLERYFRWTEGVKMRLRLIPANEVAPGTRTAGRLLFEGDSSFEIDNMECVAAHNGASGETVLSLMSDDNFNAFLQRTVFLQFALVKEAPKNATRQ